MLRNSAVSSGAIGRIAIALATLSLTNSVTFESKGLGGAEHLPLEMSFLEELDRIPDATLPTAAKVSAKTEKKLKKRYPVVIRSQKDCQELGWEAHQNASVCAATFMAHLTPPCPHLMTYPDALNYCMGVGARICTARELGFDVAKGTGCDLDDKQVWSSTSCYAGHVSKAGSRLFESPAKRTCQNDTKLLGVRCCADAYIPTPASVNSAAPAPPLDYDYLSPEAGEGVGDFDQDQGLEDALAGSMSGETADAGHFKAQGVCPKGYSVVFEHGYKRHSDVVADDIELCTAECSSDPLCNLVEFTEQRATSDAVHHPCRLFSGTQNQDDKAEVYTGVTACRRMTSNTACLELGFDVDDIDDVCEFSCEGSECPAMGKPVQFMQAESYCDELGARLCSTEEVVDDLNQLSSSVWTYNVCGRGYHMSVSNKGNTCTSDSDLAKIRCCAERYGRGNATDYMPKVKNITATMEQNAEGNVTATATAVTVTAADIAAGEADAAAAAMNLTSEEADNIVPVETSEPEELDFPLVGIKRDFSTGQGGNIRIFMHQPAVSTGLETCLVVNYPPVLTAEEAMASGEGEAATAPKVEDCGDNENCEDLEEKELLAQVDAANAEAESGASDETGVVTADTTDPSINQGHSKSTAQGQDDFDDASDDSKERAKEAGDNPPAAGDDEAEQQPPQADPVTKKTVSLDADEAEPSDEESPVPAVVGDEFENGHQWSDDDVDHSDIGEEGDSHHHHRSFQHAMAGKRSRHRHNPHVHWPHSHRWFWQPKPTPYPTRYPTKYPTRFPSPSPTKYPTQYPTKYPTGYPTKYPTNYPTGYPSPGPTHQPTKYPTTREPTTKYPTPQPTKGPTKKPTMYPTSAPRTHAPTHTPTVYPTVSPSMSPTEYPTLSPTLTPTEFPTQSPSTSPTKMPSVSPTVCPTASPTTLSPTTVTPTQAPTSNPTLPPAPMQGYLTSGSCREDGNAAIWHSVLKHGLISTSGDQDNCIAISRDFGVKPGVPVGVYPCNPAEKLQQWILPVKGENLGTIIYAHNKTMCLSNTPPTFGGEDATASFSIQKCDRNSLMFDIDRSPFYYELHNLRKLPTASLVSELRARGIKAGNSSRHGLITKLRSMIKKEIKEKYGPPDDEYDRYQSDLIEKEVQAEQDNTTDPDFMTSEKLIKELTARNLSTLGTKAELADRLADSMEESIKLNDVLAFTPTRTSAGHYLWPHKGKCIAYRTEENLEQLKAVCPHGMAIANLSLELCGTSLPGGMQAVAPTGNLTSSQMALLGAATGSTMRGVSGSDGEHHRGGHYYDYHAHNRSHASMEHHRGRRHQRRRQHQQHHHRGQMEVEVSSHWAPVPGDPKDCWWPCGEAGSKCETSFCDLNGVPDGYCCRKGWNEPGCGGDRGCKGFHCCVAPPKTFKPTPYPTLNPTPRPTRSEAEKALQRARYRKRFQKRKVTREEKVTQPDGTVTIEKKTVTELVELTSSPTRYPTHKPTIWPTPKPSSSPTFVPTDFPTPKPTSSPTVKSVPHFRYMYSCVAPVATFGRCAHKDTRCMNIMEAQNLQITCPVSSSLRRLNHHSRGCPKGEMRIEYECCGSIMASAQAASRFQKKSGVKAKGIVGDVAGVTVNVKALRKRADCTEKKSPCTASASPILSKRMACDSADYVLGSYHINNSSCPAGQNRLVWQCCALANAAVNLNTVATNRVTVKIPPSSEGLTTAIVKGALGATAPRGFKVKVQDENIVVISRQPRPTFRDEDESSLTGAALGWDKEIRVAVTIGHTWFPYTGTSFATDAASGNAVVHSKGFSQRQCTLLGANCSAISPVPNGYVTAARHATASKSPTGGQNAYVKIPGKAVGRYAVSPGGGSGTAVCLDKKDDLHAQALCCDSKGHPVEFYGCKRQDSAAHNTGSFQKASSTCAAAGLHVCGENAARTKWARYIMNTKCGVPKKKAIKVWTNTQCIPQAFTGLGERGKTCSAIQRVSTYPLCIVECRFMPRCRAIIWKPGTLDSACELATQCDERQKEPAEDSRSAGQKSGTLPVLKLLGTVSDDGSEDLDNEWHTLRMSETGVFGKVADDLAEMPARFMYIEDGFQTTASLADFLAFLADSNELVFGGNSAFASVMHRVAIPYKLRSMLQPIPGVPSSIKVPQRIHVGLMYDVVLESQPVGVLFSLCDNSVEPGADGISCVPSAQLWSLVLGTSPKQKAGRGLSMKARADGTATKPGKSYFVLGRHEGIPELDTHAPTASSTYPTQPAPALYSELPGRPVVEEVAMTMSAAPSAAPPAKTTDDSASTTVVLPDASSEEETAANATAPELVSEPFSVTLNAIVSLAELTDANFAKWKAGVSDLLDIGQESFALALPGKGRGTGKEALIFTFFKTSNGITPERAATALSNTPLAELLAVLGIRISAASMPKMAKKNEAGVVIASPATAEEMLMLEALLASASPTAFPTVVPPPFPPSPPLMRNETMILPNPSPTGAPTITNTTVTEAEAQVATQNGTLSDEEVSELSDVEKTKVQPVFVYTVRIHVVDAVGELTAKKLAQWKLSLAKLVHISTDAFTLRVMKQNRRTFVAAFEKPTIMQTADGLQHIYPAAMAAAALSKVSIEKLTIALGNTVILVEVPTVDPKKSPANCPTCEDCTALCANISAKIPPPACPKCEKCQPCNITLPVTAAAPAPVANVTEEPVIPPHIVPANPLEAKQTAAPTSGPTTNSLSPTRYPTEMEVPTAFPTSMIDTLTDHLLDEELTEAPISIAAPALNITTTITTTTTTPPPTASAPIPASPPAPCEKCPKVACESTTVKLIPYPGMPCGCPVCSNSSGVDVGAVVNTTVHAVVDALMSKMTPPAQPAVGETPPVEPTEAASSFPTFYPTYPAVETPPAAAAMSQPAIEELGSLKPLLDAHEAAAATAPLYDDGEPIVSGLQKPIIDDPTSKPAIEYMSPEERNEQLQATVVDCQHPDC